MQLGVSKETSHFRYKVVLIHTQAVTLHKNFVNFKSILHMNKKNILGEYYYIYFVL